MCVCVCVLITVRRADQNRYETVVRNTLRLARRPLAIQLLVQNWCVDRFDDGCRQVMAAKRRPMDQRDNVSPWTRQMLAPTMQASCAAGASEVARHYGIPSVSTHALLYERVLAGSVSPQRMIHDLSGLHPSRELSYWMAGMLVQLLTTGRQRLRARAGTRSLFVADGPATTGRLRTRGASSALLPLALPAERDADADYASVEETLAPTTLRPPPPLPAAKWGSCDQLLERCFNWQNVSEGLEFELEDVQGRTAEHSGHDEAPPTSARVGSWARVLRDHHGHIKPGLVSTSQGDAITFELDATGPEEHHARGIDDEQLTHAIGDRWGGLGTSLSRGGSGAADVLSAYGGHGAISVMHLGTFDPSMGRASYTCEPPCTCTPAVVDAYLPKTSWSVGRTTTLNFTSRAPSCKLTVRTMACTAGEGGRRNVDELSKAAHRKPRFDELAHVTDGATAGAATSSATDCSTFKIISIAASFARPTCS